MCIWQPVWTTKTISSIKVTSDLTSNDIYRLVVCVSFSPFSRLWIIQARLFWVVRAWFSKKKSRGWILSSKWLGLIPGTAFFALALFGLNEGNGHIFWEAWRENGFVHLMTLDACAFVLCIQLLTYEDAEIHSGQGLLWSILPILGPVLWISHRGRFL